MKRLDDVMSRLAAELAQESAENGAPLAVEQAVLAEFDRVRRSANASRRLGRVWLAAVAIAASVAAVWVVERRPAQQPAAAPAVEAESERPFVPIPFVLPPGPYERVEVVRMKLPVAELIAAGFRMQTTDLGAQAEADVMVGQDGRARAVRLVSISPFN
jgi:hypothetical protein